MPHPGSLWGKQMQCVIVVKLYYSLAFCFHSSGKIKNVHLLFTDRLLWHIPMLQDFDSVVFSSKKLGYMA